MAWDDFLGREMLEKTFPKRGPRIASAVTVVALFLFFGGAIYGTVQGVRWVWRGVSPLVATPLSPGLPPRQIISSGSPFATFENQGRGSVEIDLRDTIIRQPGPIVRNESGNTKFKADKTTLDQSPSGSFLVLPPPPELSNLSIVDLKKRVLAFTQRLRARQTELDKEAETWDQRDVRKYESKHAEQRVEAQKEFLAEASALTGALMQQIGEVEFPHGTRLEVLFGRDSITNRRLVGSEPLSEIADFLDFLTKRLPPK